MNILFYVLIILVSILLILIVLIQNPKGGGINSSFGSANQIIGVKQQTDVVEKITWYLAIALVVLCLFSAPMLKPKKVDAGKMETTVPVNLPGGNNPINNPMIKPQ
jgi:preprotein translocase subunit SecG